MMLRLSIARDLKRHPWQAVLTLLGIALGVAVVFAVDIVNDSARRAMEWSRSAFAGEHTHQIVGNGAGVPESLYVRLRTELGLRESLPVVRGRVRVAGSDETWELWGADPFADTGANTLARQASGRLPDLVGTPGSVLLTTGAARHLQLHISDSFSVRSGNRRHTLTLAITVDPRDELTRAGTSRLIVTDIATAQEVLGLYGTLSYIDLTPADSALDAVRAMLPPELRLLSHRTITGALNDMTRAFQINLTALSLLALLVGAFLVYNAMTLAALRRQRLLGLMRTLGVTRNQVLALIVTETALVGAAGLVLGLALGWLLAHGLLGMVVRTINDLYFQLSVSEPQISLLSLLKGAALGIGASILSALAPALEASRAPPGVALQRARVEHAARRSGARLLRWALVVFIAAVMVLVFSGRSLELGFAGLFLLITGFTLAAPVMLISLVRLAAPGLRGIRGLPGAMAARGVLASLSRTAVAVAALAVAVATTIAIGVMIASFRTTVADWLASFLRADIYIARDQTEAHGIDPEVIARLRGDPEIKSVHTGRWVQFAADVPTTVFAVDIDRNGFNNYRVENTAREKLWSRFRDDGVVIVSGSFAYHRRVGPGDELSLPTAGGPRRFSIGGIFTDYGSDRGVVVMHRKTYERYWRDPVITSLALYLRDPARTDDVVQRLANQTLKDQSLSIRANRTLRAHSLAIFDRTFAVTGVLRLLAMIIAAIGVFGALLAIQLERSRELSVLRTLGMTPRQLRTMLAAEGGLMGACAGLIALPLGLIMAWVLIAIINRRAFGWTLQFDVSPVVLLTGIALAFASGWLASLYPAWRMSRTAPVTALRHE